ncbi:MAG: hypothetical protein K0S97_652 [Chloroflexota bacterium]|nr:hypothetical protein [Chloroflexota bacterium]
MTPSARGRAPPAKRWAAAAVPTGTRIPPPAAWTSRAAMSWSRFWAMPASALPSVKIASAAMNGRLAPHRSAIRPASGIIRMYTSR